MTLTSPAALGLLRAIVEDPTDDLPRLLLADVLEEAGDPRGEFIRVQIELARLSRWPCGGYYCNESVGHIDCEDPARERRGALRRRERELLRTHGYRWKLDVNKLLVSRLADGVFRRGFVASVNLTCGDWCGAECPCYWTEQNSDGTCSRCHGTGRTGRHGPALVLAAPIEEVVLSDREPEFYQDWGGQRYLWHRSVGNARSGVPPCLYDRMDETIVLGRADALATLSHAALAWARQEAGLPPLRP
jgi:uncharacterized protein (TIGR02996 family)